MTYDEGHLTLMLGEAVKRSWGSLPRDVQELLFEEAMNGNDRKGGTLRERLALLLHDRHPRTATA